MPATIQHYDSNLLTPAIACPVCQTAIRGFVGMTSTVPGREVYTVWPCCCGVDGLWATAFEHEMRRRLRGEPASSVAAAWSAAAAERLAVVVATMPSLRSRQLLARATNCDELSAVEAEVLAAIAEAARYCPDYKPPSFSMSPAAIATAAASGIPLPPILRRPGREIDVSAIEVWLSFEDPTRTQETISNMTRTLLADVVGHIAGRGPLRARTASVLGGLLTGLQDVLHWVADSPVATPAVPATEKRKRCRRRIEISGD